MNEKIKISCIQKWGNTLKSKLGFYILFNSQGYMSTGSQHS